MQQATVNAASDALGFPISSFQIKKLYPQKCSQNASSLGLTPWILQASEHTVFT